LLISDSALNTSIRWQAQPDLEETCAGLPKLGGTRGKLKQAIATRIDANSTPRTKPPLAMKLNQELERPKIFSDSRVMMGSGKFARPASTC
jgi:hypothetical protein